MKKGKKRSLGFCGMPLAGVLFCLFAASMGCKQEHLPSVSTGGHDYAQINLVSDTDGFGAGRIDTNLGNPWGMAITPKGKMWICCNHSGRCVIYDGNGAQLYNPIIVPPKSSTEKTAPDGIVMNTTQDFFISGNPALCFCATENGVITAWISGDSTVAVADRSAMGAIYKGIAIANDGYGNFIYAADFFNGRIDVYDKSFNFITGKYFIDPNMPAGFAPFNIRNIGGELFVMYAKPAGPGFRDTQDGIGNGYIDIFNPDGIFVKRFASQGTLNSPWGIVEALAGFGQAPNSILVANYGDGHITVFDSLGNYQGQIESNGVPLTINSLWDISFNPSSPTQMYFTSGPGDEAHGLFGYVKVN